MPEISGKAEPSATAGGVDSSAVDQEQALFEVDEEEEEDEEVEEMEEDEEEVEEEGEDGSEGEEKEIDEVEEDGEEEEEDVEEVEEEEDVGGDGEGEEADEMDDDGADQEQEVVDEVEEEVEDGEDNEEQETEEVEVEVEEEVVEEEVMEEEEEEVEDGDGGEEEIEEEENMEEEEEGRGKGVEESGANAAEAAITVQEEAKDLCTAVKLDVHGKDQHSVSTRDQKIFSTHSNKLNDASVSNDSSIVVKHIPSEESKIPDTLLGKTCKGIQLEKEISNEAPEHVKNVCLEAHGSHNSLQSDNAKSLQLLKNDLAVEGGAKREPEIVKYDVSEKIESHLDGKNDSIPTRGLTPQRRPRSSSPGSDPDRMNKRIASVCVFYARGWCIKGKSCKFLHQKDGDSVAELQAKEDSVDYNKKSDTLCTTGSKDVVEGAHVSSAPLDSNPEVLLGSNSHLQRALVRTYGAGSHVPSNLHERYDKHTRGEFRKPVHFQPGCTSTQEEYRKPFGKMSYFESVLERQSDDALLSRRHMIDGKLLNEAPREGSPYETTISRTHLVDAFAPESKHYLDNSSISSILHQKSNSPSMYGRTEGNGIRSARGYFPNQESYNSHSLSGSLNSGFSGSFPLPQLDYRLPRAGMTSTFDSPRNTEYLDGHNSLDFDRRYHQDSSPNYLQSELRNRAHHHNISGDWTSRQTNDQYNTWEPSRPFRPSLAIGTKSLSSPASQYDPILDSIEPSGTNARDNCFSTSQVTSFQDASFYPMKTDSWEGELAKNASLHDSNAHAASDIFFDSSKLDVGNSSLPNYEKVWNPDVLVDKSDIKEAELGSEWRNLDKNRNIKESKAYRIFHSALVDFVKELLKPYWRDGQVSKDSHKTIVKKSVEKVLSALQSHQVPSTQEAINQYLAGSKPKLLKLVDGYVQKHANVNS